MILKVDNDYYPLSNDLLFLLSDETYIDDINGSSVDELFYDYYVNNLCFDSCLNDTSCNWTNYDMSEIAISGNGVALCLLGKNAGVYASYVDVTGYDIIASGAYSGGNYDFGASNGQFIGDNICTRYSFILSKKNVVFK